MLRLNKSAPGPLALLAPGAPWLWALAVLDMAAVAWMVAAGPWLDHASRFTTVMTLGGHHRVVLWLGLAGFVILTTLAAVTRGFTVVDRIPAVLITLGCAISVVALAGALSAILLGCLAALVLGFAARPLFHR